MESTNNDVKRWKYLSFALIGLLAAGSAISFVPQASAHITTNVQHMLEHIYSFVDGIEAKTNNLPADPASNTVVNTRASQDSLNSLQTSATGIDTKLTNIETIIGGLGPHSGADGANCVTIDINKDETLDKFEISPRPHPGVNFEGCDLSGAKLFRPELEGANLSGTNLQDADLTLAHLEDADLTLAHLEDADLSFAYLDRANLSGTNLSGANLFYSVLPGANLEGANLAGTNLEGAVITGTNFGGCKGTPIGTPDNGDPLPICTA